MGSAIAAYTLMDFISLPEGAAGTILTNILATASAGD